MGDDSDANILKGRFAESGIKRSGRRRSDMPGPAEPAPSMRMAGENGVLCSMVSQDDLEAVLPTELIEDDCNCSASDVNNDETIRIFEDVGIQVCLI